MKKIIVLLMGLVIFFVPFGSAFAYTGGLLHGKSLNRGADDNSIGTVFNQSTDGNETTSFGMGSKGYTTDTFWYEFASPVSIASIATKFSPSGNITVTMYDSKGTSIYSNEVSNTNGSKADFSSVKNDVKKIAFSNNSSATYAVYELDVFAPVPLGESLTNFSVSETGQVSSFSWDKVLSPSSIPFTLTGTGSPSYTQEHAVLEFTNPVSISQVDLDVTLMSTNQAFVYFYDVNKTQLGGALSYTASGIKNTNQTGIKYIRIQSSDSSKNVTVNSMKIYGAQDKNYQNISNFIVTGTHDQVSMTWDIPSGNPDFTGTKIYKNGEFLKSVDSSTKTFTDSNVSADTNYTYKITAVYSDGHETAGISKSVTTKSTPPPDRDGDGIPDDEDEFPDDPTNVGEVKNLEITTTYKSANLSWVLPKSENLQHVNIYRETLTQETSYMDKLINGNTVYAAGEKIFETNGTYFNDYTVEPGTEYEYKVTTTSVEGVESEGVTARTTTPGKPLVDFEEVSLPFSVKDLLLSGNGLLWIIGPFILLALAFLLVPKLRNLILGAFRKDSKASSEAAERRTKAEAIQKMERQEEKEFRTAREPKSERVEVAPKPNREPKEIKQPRIREPKERIRTAKLTRERIREPRAPRASREPRAPRERTRKPRDRRGIS